MPFRVFNLAEAAEYLQLEEKRVEELARLGEIPCEHQGGRLIFRHKDERPGGGPPRGAPPSGGQFRRR